MAEMIALIARLRTREEKRDEFIQAQGELARLTKEREPDTTFYEVFCSEEDPAVFTLVCMFRSREALEVHATSDFHDRLVPIIFRCLSERMTFTINRVLP